MVKNWKNIIKIGKIIILIINKEKKNEKKIIKAMLIIFFINILFLHEIIKFIEKRDSLKRVAKIDKNKIRSN